MRVLRCCLVLAVALAASPARAAFEEEQKAVDALVAQRKYASAARYLDEQPQLMAQPRFLRQLAHLLTTSYLVTLNYRMFGLRDLVEGEDLRKLRGAPGNYQLVGGDLEQRLHDALRRWPQDPQIQLAVGEYLSRGKDCGCHHPELFQGPAADPYPYLERARAAGVEDAWSLYQLGVHQLADPGGEAARGRALLEASLALDGGNLDARYDAAVACFQAGDHAAARAHAAQVAGKYGVANLDADAYYVLGRSAAVLGDLPAAERALAQALALQPSHAAAFVSLLDLLRSQRRFPEYQQRAASFIGLDLTSTWLFDVYLGSVVEAGVSDADRELARSLAARAFTRPEEESALFYGLGRLAELDKDRLRAHERYERSLSALRKQAKPPQGAVDALTQLVKRSAAPPGAVEER